MTEELDPEEPLLARLADGSLPADERERLGERIDRSPRLRAQLDEQQRALTLLRAFDAPAPASLRASIEAEIGAPAIGRSRRAAGRHRRGPALVIPALTALAVAVAAVLVALRGATGTPTVPQAARLALAAATMPAPAVDASDPSRLRLSAAGIPFPNWASAGGWKAVGARSDVLDGRRVQTVFYADRAGTRVGYAIVSGAALAVPGGGRTVTLYGGAGLTLGRVGGARLITWRRDGHTCVIAGRTISDATLVTLANGESGPGAGSASATRASLSAGRAPWS